MYGTSYPDYPVYYVRVSQWDKHLVVFYNRLNVEQSAFRISMKSPILHVDYLSN